MKLFQFIFLALLFSCDTVNEEEKAEICGTYTLVEWKGVRPDGSIAYPYGEKAEGMIQYDTQGMMSMQLQRSDRELIGTDDYDSVDVELILSSFKGFFSYYGPYSINEDQGLLTHYIEGCKNPDWVGRELKRRYQLTGTELILRSDSVIGMDHILRWKKIEN